MKKTLLISAFAIFLTGCSWFTTVRRYRAIEPSITEKYDTNNESSVKVNMKLSDTRIEPEETKTSYKSIFDLQGQGQKEFLAITNKRFNDDDKFLGNLSNKYLKSDDDEKPTIDFTKKKVKLVFSIDRLRDYKSLGKKDDGFSLGDRIEFISYTLKLKDSKLHFVNWNKYSTEFGSINIADVSFQSSISGGLGFGDSTSGLNASVSASGSRTENQHIQYRYIQLSGSIDRESLHLQSEGTRETDLSGNVIAEVTMKFDPATVFVFSIEKSKGKDDKFKKPDSVDIGVLQVSVPSIENLDSVNANLNYKYAYRHIVKKSKTFFEWDDKIIYYTGEVSKRVTILLPNEIMPSFSCIINNGQSLEDDKNFIKIKHPAGSSGFTEAKLLFPDMKSADDFLLWLSYYPCDASPAALNAPIKFKNDFTLIYNGAPLTRAIVNTINSTGKFFMSDKYYQANKKK